MQIFKIILPMSVAMWCAQFDLISEGKVLASNVFDLFLLSKAVLKIQIWASIAFEQ